MKKTMKSAAAALLCAVLLGGALLAPPAIAGAESDTAAAASSAAAQAKAQTREEVIYANLTPAGAVKDIYAVSILDVAQAGIITDYGAYSAVKNLTNTEEITLDGNQVSVNAPAGEFYYQGTLKNNELPWTVDISYLLDGSVISAEDLAGRSGHLDIRIVTAQNIKADPSYFDNYMLQISVTLDPALCKNITTDGTIANAGSNKLLTFAIMPGKTGDASLQADVTSFTMQGIEFAAVPLSMDIDTPDITDMKNDLSTLSDAVSDLNDGIEKLRDGTLELKNGAADLKSGSNAFNGGLAELSGGSGTLVAGSSEIKNALNTIASSLNGSGGGSNANELDLGALSQLPDGLSRLAAGLDDVGSGLTELQANFSAAYLTLDASISEIPDGIISEQALAELYQASPENKDTLDLLKAYYAAGIKSKSTYQGVKPAFDAVGSTIDTVVASVYDISDTLYSTSNQLTYALESNDTASMLMQLVQGLSALNQQYGGFHDGLVSYTEGVKELAGNYGALNAGISGISGGVGELYDGMGELYEGSSEMNDAVKDLPEQMEQETDSLIDEYDKSDFIPVSFVSSENEHTNSVQFVMKTESIEAPEIQEETGTKQEEENFWTRFLSLFQ
jgi:putative membrane protein